MKSLFRYTGAPKETFDFVGSSLLLVILSPLLLLISVLIRASSPGPIIFCQKRLTKNGKVFILYKFRTMVLNAETKTGAVWADVGDSRITKLGQFMRRTRFDELPQLYNVFCGDMSLIGPRPERPEFSQMLTEQLPLFKKRTNVKAGLTGLAQTKLGYSASLKHYRRKVALDSIYIDNCCLLLDLRIALKTISVLVSGFGAR